MKRLIGVVLLLLVLCGCQSAHDVHNGIEDAIKRKYPNDVLEYAGPSGDTAFSSNHEFFMHSEALDDTFLLLVRDWRSDNPQFFETYMSVKYKAQAETKAITDMEEAIGFFGDGYRVSSTFDHVLNPMGLSANLTFEQWYNQITDSVHFSLLIKLDNPEIFDIQKAVELVQGYRLTLPFQNSFDLIWCNDYAFSLDEESLESNYVYTEGGYFARVSIGVSGEASWCNYTKDSYTWGAEPFIASVLEAEHQLAVNKARAEWVESHRGTGELWPGYSEDVESADIVESPGVEDEPRATMPDPDALESAINHANDYFGW